MANCPHCSEQYGIRQVLFRANCAYCNLPVRLDEQGRLETYASKHGRQILEKPRGIGYWLLLVGGVAATLVISLVPTGGILVAIVFPILQAFCLDRSVQRFQMHLGFMHGLTADFYSGILFLLMVLTEALANFLSGPISAVVNVLIFLSVWWVYGKYFEMHFRQVTNKTRPSTVELSIIAIILGLVILPPFVLLVYVLIAYFTT